MKTADHPLDRLQELPADLFELSGKLDYADWGPVITVKVKPIVAEPPAVAAAAESRASHTISSYMAWIIGPHVICYPFPDQVATASLNMENSKPGPGQHAMGLQAIAGARRFYKLSRLGGIDLPTRYGCHVHYGPWYAQVTRTQSCYDGVPDRWELSASVLGMTVIWYGQWEDIPAIPNFTVVMGSLSNGQHTFECCPGYVWCPTTGSCLSTRLDCQDPML